MRSANYLAIFYRITFWLSCLGLLILLGDLGFSHDQNTQVYYDYGYFAILILGVVATIIRYFRDRKRLKKKALFFDALTVILTIYLIKLRFIEGYEDYYKEGAWAISKTLWVKFAIIFTFIREFSEQKIVFKRAILNPAQLFILSFLAIIFIGSFLLQLPNATHEPISYIDSLFTSTSAVCVTGLIVLDTGTDFTVFGQTIILILIQIGGLGILTFASYFSYFFSGGSSYENQLTLSDITSSRKISQVFSTLKYIIVITVLIEAISGLVIYTSLNEADFSGKSDMIFFSIFHSISAFCNAGFSTLSAGLSDEAFRFNYYLQSTLILTFVLGGLGFPIVANIYEFVKYRVQRLIKRNKRAKVYRPWVLNIDSRITLITTLTISALSIVIFFIMEYQNILDEHDGIGKFVTAVFGATTPRTAGFNTFDFADLNFATIMLIILLMWIGASPQSTGGGIKTSTFAIATLNILSIAKGKNRIEVFRREIADFSVRRAFAIISLSLIAIGISILIIASIESEFDLLEIAFECFSAYSTVGLSLGVTADFTVPSKIVLIALMFVGRISMLSLVIAVVKKTSYKNYRYPQEELTIN